MKMKICVTICVADTSVMLNGMNSLKSNVLNGIQSFTETSKSTTFSHGFILFAFLYTALARPLSYIITEKCRPPLSLLSNLHNLRAICPVNQGIHIS